jgi:hypothetical protein
MRVLNVLPNILLNSLLVVAGGSPLLAPSIVRADTPGHHPHYLHARGDLQEARWLLSMPSEPDADANLRSADGEIEAAVTALNKAAWSDAKNVESRAHPDQHIDRIGRYRNLMRLLERSRKDLAAEEDNAVAMDWRDEAYHHIDAAMALVRHAAVDAHIDHELGW